MFRSLARLAGAVLRQSGREDTWIMTREQLEDWIPRLAAIEPEQRVALPGITPERTMQIVGGGIVAISRKGVGIGTFGPMLNKKGNSVGGEKILQVLSRELGLHVFDLATF